MIQEPQDSDNRQPVLPPSHATNLPANHLQSNQDERSVSHQSDAGLIDLTIMQATATSTHLSPARSSADTEQVFARPPIAGALSVIFAIVAFYHTTLLMAPLAMLCGVIALFRRQFNWGIIGIVAGIVALISDITFWTLLGVTWAIHWLWWV
jgi:energy-converting hydrogenase Eha subunit A